MAFYQMKWRLCSLMLSERACFSFISLYSGCLLPIRVQSIDSFLEVLLFSVLHFHIPTIMQLINQKPLKLLVRWKSKEAIHFQINTKLTRLIEIIWISVFVLGYICCSVTIMFFAAPCCMIADVIKKRSAEMLPLPLIFMSFVSSVQWLAFGMIAKDPFIQVPNLLGAILSGMQLSLFCIYPNKSRMSAASSNSEVPYAIF